MTYQELNLKPWSWRCGYWSGGWQPTERDKEPPQNPVAKGTPEWEQWEEGFRFRKAEMQT